jgi:hypothetical protein
VYSVHFLNMLKKEIKDKSNSDKITLYTFKRLNAQFQKKHFHNNWICLANAPEAFSFMLTMHTFFLRLKNLVFLF